LGHGSTKQAQIMDFFPSSVPIWVSVLFIFSIQVPIFVLARMAQTGAQRANLGPAKANRYYKIVVAFYYIYFFYVSGLGLMGLFQENVLPPKIQLLTTGPLLLFYFALAAGSKTMKAVLGSLNLGTLIRFHAIRFIGVFFLFHFYYNALPPYFALSAGLGDILAAASALWVARLADQQARHYKTAVIAWNIFGLLDILHVVTKALLVTKNAIETGSEGVLALVDFPFCLIPAFAPATIIFIHLRIFVKLWAAQRPTLLAPCGH
jgi:hypothetical protein